MLPCESKEKRERTTIGGGGERKTERHREEEKESGQTSVAGLRHCTHSIMQS